MHHATIKAESATERNRPLTHHGQPVAGLRLHLMSERDAAYAAALELVALIEPSPNCDGSWCVDGIWYHSLGAAVGAILREAGDGAQP